MGFLNSVIADARSGAPQAAATDSLAPVADLGHTRLNPSLASGAGDGGAEFREPMGAEGKIAAAAEVSGPQRSTPTLTATPGGGLEPLSGASGGLPEAAFSGAPLAMKPSEYRPDIDRPGETEGEAVWPESRFRLAGGISINTGASAEPVVTEVTPRQLQPRMANGAPLPDGQISAPEAGAYSPLPIGGWKPEPSPDASAAVHGLADSPGFISRPPGQDIQPVPAVPESRSTANKLPEQNTQYPSFSVTAPEPEPVTSPEWRLPPRALDDAGVKPLPAAANTGLSPKETRPPVATVRAEQSIREPSLVKRQEAAVVQAAGHAAPVTRPEPVKALIHPPGADSPAREKAGVASSGGSMPEQRPRNPARARSAFMHAMPQPASRTPEVKIGQVDVFIETPARPGNSHPAAQRPTPSLASRHYLRRV